MTAPREVLELTAQEWVFLTLGAGLTLQKNDKVIMQRDMAERTKVELAAKVTDTTDVSFDFVDGDVNPGTNKITENSHGMSNGQPLRLTNSGGALPAGLAENTDYYVISAGANDFELSLTKGGSAVDITAAAGGGTHTLTKFRDDLRFVNFEIVPA